jgi:5'-3' exonuclease
MEIHLIDGTYELFRHFYALPSAKDETGQEIAAVRGVLHSMLALTREGATHIGVATDHVIESFRNDLWSEYKTGEGVDQELLAQFPLLEEALTALGIVVWPMIEFEADDALASAANTAAQDKRVDRVLICTPDKDLAQCVRGTRIVQLDRRKRALRDEAGVIERFGVAPASIPDYLALVGDAADGYPGLKGWGAKSAAAVIAHFKHLEHIPADAREWRLSVTSPATLAKTFAQDRDKAFLFRDLATLRTEIALFGPVDDLLWSGPTSAFPALAARLDSAVTAKNTAGQPGRARQQIQKQQIQGRRLGDV